MNVIIASGGKFHAFSLAEQLAKRNALKTLYTTYFNPQKNAKGFKINENNVKTFLLPKLILYVASKIFSVNKASLYYITSKQFGRWVSKRLENADIFVGWSGYSVEPFIEAKKRGMIKILERGSTHILEQKELLSAEYNKLGINYNEIHNGIIDRELFEYENADFIFIPSSFAKKSFLKHGIPEKKLITIPYGVDTNKFRCFKKNNNKEFIIIQVGCSIQKGTHYLIQAFNELKLKNAKLFLVGHCQKELTKFLKNTKNIKLLGNLNLDGLIDIYSQSSLFVLPSIQEGFGMVILEAMSCGLPVICSWNTGGKDIIRDGQEGFLVPPGDIDALKEKILFFYENRDLLTDFKRRARQKAEKFTWDVYGNKIYDKYEEILTKYGLFSKIH